MRQTTLIACGSLFFLASCFSGGNAGNSMETENSVAFQIKMPDGRNAAYASYRLIPIWYLPGDADSAQWERVARTGKTDKYGRVLISELEVGTYIVEFFNDSLAGSMVLRHEDSSRPQIAYQILLESRGAIRGRVPLADSVSRAQILIYGSSLSATTDSLGNFFIANLPVGTFRLIAVDPRAKTLIAEASFTVLAGDTVGLGVLSPPSASGEDPALWPYSRSVSPVSLISEWMRPLRFPTVLTLYLNSDFDFSQASSDGKDLRLFASGGRQLRFDLKRWEPSLKRAVLKIRLDDASDTLGQWSLCWGRSPVRDPGRANVWQGIGDSLRLALNSLLLDHFEHSTNRNQLPAPIPVGYWFVTQPESTQIYPGARDDFTLALQPAGYGRSGKAAHFTFTANPPKWVLVGTTLGRGTHSLATLDSIEFWLRGNARISVAFENNSKDTLGMKSWTHLRADSLWTRHAIRPQDLLPRDNIGGNVGWEAVKDSITNISFFASNGTEFSLDEIRLYGVSCDDLLR